MFKFFSNITLRSLYKRGLFPIINILGLSIGLAVVLLISLLIFHEYSFDRGFKESKNIYRINSKFPASSSFGSGQIINVTSNAIGPAIEETIPEVISTVRISANEQNFLIKGNPVDISLTWADKDFFRLFDTPFIHGTPEEVMSRPNAVAISEEMAKTLFGNDSPIGETLTFAFNYFNQPPMEVVAVFKDYPVNSSFRDFKAIASYTHSFQTWMNELNWSGIGYETFCLLNANADTAVVNAKMRKTLVDAVSGDYGKEVGENWFFSPQLQRLTDIYLYSAEFGAWSLLKPISDIGKVKMMSLLSLIILLVACINYMNLSTARAQKRSREIGVCKTIGAKRREIIYRLTLETAIFTFVSFVVAFLMAWLTLPIFNTLLDKQLNIEIVLQPGFLGIALLIWMVTTLLTAAYPAIYMSGFPPIKAIRSQFAAKSSHATIRKILSVGQFAVAIVLIAWVLIIQAQIAFVNNKDLGYNSSNLIGFWTKDASTHAMLNDFRAESSVEMAACQSSNLFMQSRGNYIRKNSEDKTGLLLMYVAADPDLIDLLQIKLIAGRHLPEQQEGDTITQILVNRATVEYLETTPEEAIGQRVPGMLMPVEVCGVMENFHFQSLHSPIKGYGIVNHVQNWYKNFMLLRVKEGNLSEQLKTYERIYKKHLPNSTFDPQFPEQHIAKAYADERRTGKIAIVFSILAILVACMGVFGLTAFMAEQRTKEIGIRKVLGASVRDIVRLFTNSYAKLLCISLVIAIPAAWWVGNQYLQNFAFRIPLGWWIFAVTALVIVVLTLLTVSVQAIKAASKNPVEAIKVE